MIDLFRYWQLAGQEYNFKQVSINFLYNQKEVVADVAVRDDV